MQALLGRSHRLGADRRITNFAGGNTSAKVTLADPVTGEPTRVLLVKGSGGDLGTPHRRRPRRDSTSTGVRALERLVRQACTRTISSRTTTSCRFGIGGAAAVDRHAVARAARRRPRRPHPSRRGDRAGGRRRRRAPRRRTATATTSGGSTGNVRGSSSGCSCATSSPAHPAARGVVLGGHGVICWGAIERRVRGDDARPRATRRAFLAEHGRDRALRCRGAVVRAAPRRRPASRGHAARSVVARASPSRTRPVVGHFDDSPVVLDFLAVKHAPATRGRSAPRAPTTSSPRRSARCCSTCRPSAPFEDARRSAARAARAVPRRLRARTTTRTRRRVAADPRRRPGRSCSSPGVGHVELRHRRADRRASPASSS